MEYLDAESVVNAYSDMMYSIAKHILSSREDAEDAVSDAFLNYFKKDWEFESEEHRRSWFIRVVTNCCYDTLRKRRDFVDIDDGLSEVIAAPEDVDREENLDLQAAVNSLPPVYRMTVVLHYLNDVPVKEIADMLGTNENTIKSRLHHARKLLQKAMGTN